LIHVRGLLEWLGVFLLVKEVDDTAIGSFVFGNHAPLKKMVDHTLKKAWDRGH